MKIYLDHKKSKIYGDAIFDDNFYIFEDWEKLGEKPGFKAHYRHLRLINHSIIDEECKSFAILGCGDQPVGKDLNEDFPDIFEKFDMDHLVVIDYSPEVLISGINNFIAHGIPPEKIVGIQVDLSLGMASQFHESVIKPLFHVCMRQVINVINRITDNPNMLTLSTKPSGLALIPGHTAYFEEEMKRTLSARDYVVSSLKCIVVRLERLSYTRYKSEWDIETKEKDDLEYIYGRMRKLSNIPKDTSKNNIIWKIIDGLIHFIKKKSRYTKDNVPWRINKLDYIKILNKVKNLEIKKMDPLWKFEDLKLKLINGIDSTDASNVQKSCRCNRGILSMTIPFMANPTYYHLIDVLSRLLKLHVLSKEQHDELHQEFLKKYREFNRRVIKAVMTNVAALMTDDAKVVITSDVDKFYENKVMDTEYVWKLEDSEGNALVEGIREFGEELGYEVVPPAGSLKDSENSGNDLKKIFKVGGDRVLWKWLDDGADAFNLHHYHNTIGVTIKFNRNNFTSK